MSSRNPIDSLLSSLTPHTFRYKHTTDGLSSDNVKNSKPYLGVIAQRVEVEPHGFGSQIVTNTPNGKVLEMKPLVSALSAGAGRLHERANSHEDIIHGLMAATDALQDHVHKHASAISKLHAILGRKLGKV